MPNPPIRVGSLPDVPAPGSAIASHWAQAASAMVAHVFPTAADRAALWPNPPAGAVSTAMDRNYLERYNGLTWVRVGGTLSFQPAYSAPAGAGSGGAIVPGGTGRVARWTMPRATTVRAHYAVLLGATGPYTGQLFLLSVSGGATIWNTFVAGGPASVTAIIPGIDVPGLGAGDHLDVMFTSNAASTGQVSWFLDTSNNRGRLELDAPTPT